MRHYDHQPSGTIDRARQLRRESTPHEKLLWRALRESFPGLRWRRQMPIGPYFADFTCFSEKLIVEADGGQHGEATSYDEARTRFMKRQGYTVLRFWNNEVVENVEGVIDAISLFLGEREGAAQPRKGDGEARSGSPSPSQPAAGPLPLPMGEEL